MRSRRVLLFVVSLLTTTTIRAQDPDVGQTLQMIASFYESCADVTDVQREGSSFRIYENNGAQSYLEFDLDDFNTPSKHDVIAILECSTGACVHGYMADSMNPGSWKKYHSYASLTVVCDSDVEVKLTKLYRYYYRMLQQQGG
ncbi:hypothetical protein [Rhodanobacter sp. OK091]|uniref:hypothetical protein n=1 Tax=Rhodanobacter sp. OK091 TaxID=1881037 RepID=UPI001C4A54B8|nr:hypothetical protein [Rhodanobacter sp. OK091]